MLRQALNLASREGKRPEYTTSSGRFRSRLAITLSWERSRLACNLASQKYKRSDHHPSKCGVLRSLTLPAHQGPKPFLWFVASFILLQIIAGLALDYFPSIRDPEFAGHSDRLKSLVADAPDRPLVIMLGSSRTALGFQAGSLNRSDDGPPVTAYNLGLMAGGAHSDLMALQRLLVEGIRPDHVLVEIFPLFFNQPHGRSLEEIWFAGGRLSATEMLGLKKHHGDGQRLVHQWARDRWFTSFFRRADFRAAFHLDQGGDMRTPPADSFGYRGYYPDDMTDSGRLERQRHNHVQYAQSIGPFRLAPGPSRALQALLDLCREENIRVTLVLMPEAKSFHELYGPGVREGLDAFLADLCQTHGVPLIDARDWIADEHFWDVHHLLPSGAAQFTSRLAREAIEPARQ